VVSEGGRKVTVVQVPANAFVAMCVWLTLCGAGLGFVAGCAATLRFVWIKGQQWMKEREGG